MAYSTPYMTFEENEYAQFHPSSAFESLAVVDANRNTPVATLQKQSILPQSCLERDDLYVHVEMERVPLRPR